MDEFTVFIVGAVFSVIGSLISMLLVVAAWALRNQVASLRESICTLTEADRKLAEGLARNDEEVKRVERLLAEHKLHVAETYARNDTVAKVFQKLDELRTSIMDEIRELFVAVNKRIDYHHQPKGGQ